jgi:hypothetical protein
LISMGFQFVFYWCQLISIDSQIVSIAFTWFLWISIDLHWFPLLPIGVQLLYIDSELVAINLYCFLLISIDFH